MKGLQISPLKTFRSALLKIDAIEVNLQILAQKHLDINMGNNHTLSNTSNEVIFFVFFLI